MRYSISFQVLTARELGRAQKRGQKFVLASIRARSKLEPYLSTRNACFAGSGEARLESVARRLKSRFQLKWDQESRNRDRDAQDVFLGIFDFRFRVGFSLYWMQSCSSPTRDLARANRIITKSSLRCRRLHLFRYISFSVESILGSTFISNKIFFSIPKQGAHTRVVDHHRCARWGDVAMAEWPTIARPTRDNTNLRLNEL